MRILIGYDGSGGARAAVSDLSRAGLPVDAEVLVLSVADAVAPTALKGDTPEAGRVARAGHHVALDEAAAWADEGRRKVLEVEPSWNVRCETRADSPAWSLLQRADTWNADLLVVGCTGRSAAERTTFGSVAGKLLHDAPCTVRIGRGRPAKERPGGERIVVGVDGSPGSEAGVAALLRRRWNTGSAVRVVTAVDAAALSAFTWFGPGHPNALAWIRTFNEVAVEKCAAAGLDTAPILAEGDAKRVLVAEAGSWGADCIFVGADAWHGAQRSLLGSVASAVAARARCSVEIVRPVLVPHGSAGARPGRATIAKKA